MFADRTRVIEILALLSPYQLEGLRVLSSTAFLTAKEICGMGRASNACGAGLLMRNLARLGLVFVRRSPTGRSQQPAGYRRTECGDAVLEAAAERANS